MGVERVPSRFATAASRVPGWEEFRGPGSGDQAEEMRRWVLGWADDIRRRLASGAIDTPGTSGPEPDWDEYLNE